MVPEKRLRQLAGVGIEMAALATEYDALFLKAAQEVRVMTGAAYSSLGLVEGETNHWLAADGKPREEVRGYRQPISEG